MTAVSMPPRRSCFVDEWGHLKLVIISFNATTAFLLPGLSPEASAGLMAFQCHHGVPASSWPSFPSTSSTWRFNATTAFLLRGTDPACRSRSFRFQCHHGVPASLSANGIRVERAEFQCHHGVPASPGAHRAAPRDPSVSMPPRRSCFRRMGTRCWIGRFGFNATTAFLLRDERHARLSGDGCFNATTAFLLHGERGEPPPP